MCGLEICRWKCKFVLILWSNRALAEEAEKSGSDLKIVKTDHTRSEAKTIDHSDHLGIEADELNAAMHYIDFQKPNWFGV